MFKSKNKEDRGSSNSSVSSGGSSSTNSLVEGTSVEGTLIANNDIRIDGNLKGILDCKGRVIIGPKGSIDGEVTCQNAVIEGKFSGTLRVKELLNVKESAVIDGDVQTNKLMVQPGAIYNVSCSMGGQTLKAFVGKNNPQEKAVVG